MDSIVPAGFSDVPLDAVVDLPDGLEPTSLARLSARGVMCADGVWPGLARRGESGRMISIMISIMISVMVSACNMQRAQGRRRRRLGP